MTVTTPIWNGLSFRLGLFMVNLCTKFEVSGLTRWLMAMGHSKSLETVLFEKSRTTSC